MFGFSVRYCWLIVMEIEYWQCSLIFLFGCLYIYFTIYLVFVLHAHVVFSSNLILFTCQKNVTDIFRSSKLWKCLMCLYQLLCSTTSSISFLSAPSSSLFSRGSFPVVSYPGSSQTSQRRRGARFTVRADSVSVKLFCFFFEMIVGAK